MLQEIYSQERKKVFNRFGVLSVMGVLRPDGQDAALWSKMEYPENLSLKFYTFGDINDKLFT